MKKKFLSFLIQILIFSILILGIAFVIFQYTNIANYYLPIFPYLLLFFILITILSQYIQVFSGESIKFVGKFMISKGIKFFSYLGFVTIYIFTNKDTTVPFLVGFLVLYLFFTLFDVISLLKTFKQNKK